MKFVDFLTGLLPTFPDQWWLVRGAFYVVTWTLFFMFYGCLHSVFWSVGLLAAVVWFAFYLTYLLDKKGRS